jgi:hypothetical protein
MQYVLLIYTEESTEPAPGTKEFETLMREYGAFTEDVRKKGVFQFGLPLEPVATATTLRVRNAKTVATDGPFAETKEQLGGFYVLDCKNLDEALEYAARIPGAKVGCIEVRPVMAMEGP